MDMLPVFTLRRGVNSKVNFSNSISSEVENLYAWWTGKAPVFTLERD